MRLVEITFSTLIIYCVPVREYAVRVTTAHSSMFSVDRCRNRCRYDHPKNGFFGFIFVVVPYIRTNYIVTM